MSDHPKKSKALIITFIAVLFLLIAGYFIFKNSDQIFGAKNSANIAKTFAPLLGTSKQKDASTINNGSSNSSSNTNATVSPSGTGNTTSQGTSTSTNNGSTTGTGAGLGVSGGATNTVGGTNSGTTNGTNLNGSTSGLNGTTGSGTSGGATGTIATTGGNTGGALGGKTGGTTGGSFGSGGSVSGGSGFGSGSFGSSGGLGNSTGFGSQTGFGTPPPSIPLPTPNGSTPRGTAPIASGSSTQIGSGNGSTSTTSSTNTYLAQAPDPNACPDDPLIFTDSEKVELADLLKQYYLIAPSLKNADDVALLDNDIATNQALINQATSLTAQCESQKSASSYSGPRQVKDNPYFTASINSDAYLTAFSDFEKLFNIW